MSETLNNQIDNKLNSFLDNISKTPVALAIIFVFAVIIYGQTLYFGFTYLDDKVIIVENILSQKKVLNVSEAFNRDAFFSKDGLAFYRPLQNLSYMIDAVYTGKNAGGYHLTNLIFHILTCFSIFYLFKVLKYNNRISLLVALLYTVHPIFTHAVAWIPSRGDLLIAFFGIVSFIGFIKFVETKNYIYFALTILTFVIALFSKETAALLPIVFAGYYLFLHKKKKFDKSIIIPFALYALTILINLNYRNKVVITRPNDNSFSLQSFMTNIPTIPEIFAKFIIPINLSTMPKFSTLVTTIGTILILVLAALIIMKKKGNYKPILFGLGWWLMFAVPAMAYRHNYADFGYEYFEHRSYLQMIGIFIVLIELYNSYKPKISLKQLTAFFVGLIMFFSGYSYFNAKNYNNIFTFFGRAIDVDSKNALANYNMGNYSKEKQNPKAAKKYFEAAIRVNPEYLEAYQNLADVENFLGNKDEAMRLLKTALNVNSYYYQAWKFLGILYNQKSMNQDAITTLNAGLRLRQNDPEVYNILGVIYAAMGSKDSAVIMYKKAIEVQPDFVEASRNLIELYKSAGDLNQSSEALKSSTELVEKQKSKNPKAVENYITLGELYGRQGQFDKSIIELKKALDLDPKNSRAYNNMGTAYAIQKKFTEAIVMFQKAIEFEPNNPSFYFNLGLAYIDTKRRAKGIELIKKSAQLGWKDALGWLKSNNIAI